MGNRWAAVLGVTVLGILVGGGLVIAVAQRLTAASAATVASTSGPGSVMTGRGQRVPDSVLALSGVTVQEVDPVQTGLLTKPNAESIASAGHVDRVQHSVLVDATFRNPSGLRCLCWLVTFHPGHRMQELGPAGRKPDPSPIYAAHSYVLLDARTGRLIYGAETSRP